MATATYKLSKVRAGRCHYAEVTATAEFAHECSVAVSPESFAWLRDVYGPNAVWNGPGFDPERKAAEAGVRFALEHVTGRDETVCARIVIESIHFSDTDTTAADIEEAACRAVWQALGVRGAEFL